MKILNLFTLLVLTLLAVCSSCRKDLDFELASQEFGFSRDTVYLDTVFTTIRSETYSVKIYNNQDKDVNIPRIYLEQGNTSYYKINVDGQSGNDFSEIPLRANDSLYVFVEIAPLENTPNAAMIEENLLVESLAGQQTVKLVSLVEDADFYFPNPGEDEVEITTNTTWNNAKSKVIFGKLKFTNADLTIEAGTKVYFHKKSGLEIDGNSTLTINGNLGNEVILRGDRHDLRYDTLPANWDRIKLLPNAIANINYATIKGGFTGLEMENATVNITNSKIFNHVEAGIISYNATLNGSNLLMNNSGVADLAVFGGGNYNLNHCTFANYYDLGGGNAYAVYFSNNYENDVGNLISNNLAINFGNCIMYNDGFNSFSFNDDGLSAFNYSFDNCLVKFTNINTYDPQLDANFTACLFNQDPLFTNILASRNQLSVANSSPAKAFGNNTIAASFPIDYYGVNRTTNPTAGAVQ